MQQMMMMMMQNQQGGNQQGGQPAPAGAMPNPQTKAEVQALIDALEMKLANGEISEAVYNKLVAKWEERLSKCSKNVS